jgi:hypothetical protein
MEGMMQAVTRNTQSHKGPGDGAFLLSYATAPSARERRIGMTRLATIARKCEPTAAPEVTPARGPPLWEQAAPLHLDDTPAPAPEYVFDQRVSW